MDDEMNTELLDDVVSFTSTKNGSLIAAMSLIVMELNMGDINGAMETLRSYGAAMAYAYTEHRIAREDAVQKLFFGEEK
jgi:hypothetical protein